MKGGSIKKRKKKARRLERARSQVDNHGAGNDHVLGQLSGQRGLVGEGDVNDAGQVLGDDTSSAGGEGSKGGTSDDLAVGETAELCALGLVRLDVQGVASRQSSGLGAGSHGQGGERLDGEVGTIGARLDEGSGQREDLPGAQRSVKGTGGAGELRDDVDGGLVAGLNGEDGAGSGQDRLVLDQGSGSQVSRDTDALEDGCGTQHASGVGELEVVLAGLDGLGAGLSDGALQEGDVGLLAGTNAEEIGDLLGGSTKGLELGGGELGETLLVEGGLEVLKGQSELQDVDIGKATGRVSGSRRGGLALLVSTPREEPRL